MVTRFYGIKTGVRKVSVPNIIGINKTQARIDLSNISLTYLEQTTPGTVLSDNDIVSAQGTASGSVIPRGSVVQYTYKVFTFTPPYFPPFFPPFFPPHFPPFFPPYFPAAALPGVPTGVTATNDGTNTTISWNAVSGATSYDIWYQSGPTYSGTSRDFGPITGTSYVTPTSSLFYYFVRAVNATGNGSYSAGVLATGGSTPPFFPPYFPGIRGY